MDTVFHYNWYYSGESYGRKLAEEAFHKIQKAIESGNTFPFADHHYEIGLISAADTPTTNYWMLAFLVMTDAIEDDSLAVSGKLYNWLGEVDIARWDDRSSDIARGNTLRQCLNKYYTIYQSICDGTVNKYIELPSAQPQESSGKQPNKESVKQSSSQPAKQMEKPSAPSKKDGLTGQTCSICGMKHPEVQLWQYGTGFSQEVSTQFSHRTANSKVFITTTKYENVKYYKEMLCRDCVDLMHFAGDINEKNNTLRCISLILHLVLLVPILGIRDIPSMIVCLIINIVLFICRMLKVCSPPLYYPFFDKWRKINIDFNSDRLANFLKTVKNTTGSRKSLMIWIANENDMLVNRVNNPKFIIKPQKNLNMAKYQRMLKQADVLSAKGKIYIAFSIRGTFRHAVPTPEGMLALGHLLERTGRLKEALSAYSLSKRLVEDTAVPSGEYKRLFDIISKNGLFHRKPDDEITDGIKAEHDKRIGRIKKLLDKPARSNAKKAARQLIYLSVADDLEGLELYAKAMDILKRTDDAKRARSYIEKLRSYRTAEGLPEDVLSAT